MEINFDNLKKIDTILEKIEILEQKINSEKRWLNINEASNYLGYSKDHIHKLKESYFIENKHYYKKSGRILFDKLELDNNSYFPDRYIEKNGIIIDEKMGKLLGLLVAEGTNTNRNKIEFVSTDKSLIDDIISQFDFDWKIYTRKDKGASRKFYNN